MVRNIAVSAATSPTSSPASPTSSPDAATSPTSSPDFVPDFRSFLWQETQEAARKLRVQLQALEVRRPEDLEGAFGAARRGRAGALLTFDDSLTLGYRSQIVALAGSTRLPAMYGLREFPDAGGLMSYGPNRPDLYRRTATFVDKILKGTKPADLPVEQPTRFELVINMNELAT